MSTSRTMIVLALSVATSTVGATTLLSEAFATYPPPGWTEAVGLLADPTTLSGTSSAWTADGFGNIGTTGAAKLNIYGTNRKEWMFTPQINLGAGGNYWLEFDIALTVWNQTTPSTLGVDDTVAVVISTDGGATCTSRTPCRCGPTRLQSRIPVITSPSAS